MEVGTVVLWNGDKGFGFIRPDLGGNDVYFHHSTLDRECAKGDRLSFEIEQGPRGCRVRKAQHV